MGILSELKTMLTKHEITFVESMQESNDIFTFRFNTKPGLKWRAGQHCIFNIEHKKIKKGIRPFSVSSAPEEGFVDITTRVPDNHPSEFKKALKELKPGMTIGVRGGVGPMHIDDNRTVILLAAGLGVTPFRAIYEGLCRNKTYQPQLIKLLHSDKEGQHLFQNNWLQNNLDGRFQVELVNGTQQFEEQVCTLAKQYGNTAVYMIAGPFSMMKGVSKLLKQCGIEKRNMKKDFYFGL